MNPNTSYKVSATSHIACVKFTINTEIPGDKVAEVLADGVLYNTQRAAASKAVKALGGGKRSEIPFTAKAEEAVREALVALFPDAEISTSEYRKGETTVTKKFVATRSIIVDKIASGATVEEIAERAGFDGEVFDEETGDYTSEFLAAVDARIKKLAAAI